MAEKKKATTKTKEVLVAASVRVYKGEDGDWWWHAVAANNKKVDGSLEGYKNRGYAVKVARDLNPGIPISMG